MTGTGLLPSCFSMLSTDLKKSAPSLSILLMKREGGHAVPLGLAPDRLRLGLDALLAVEDSDCSIQDAQARSTSTVKSTWPGVSMMLTWSTVLPVGQVVAADVIVMPRSCSWAIQSMVALPSWTSPIL
jgi:hypothetical protein